MRAVVFSVALLVALYTLARNNIGVLPDQIVWVTRGSLSFKVILPAVMVALSALSLASRNKSKVHDIAIFLIVLDAILRAGTLIDFYYLAFTYGFQVPPEMPVQMPGVSVFVENNVPVAIMLLLELLVLTLYYKSIFRRSGNT